MRDVDAQQARGVGVVDMHRSLRYYDIARRLGIPASRLSEYVRGAYEIPWHHQIAICELLECAPDDILGVAEPLTYDLTDG